MMEDDVYVMGADRPVTVDLSSREVVARQHDEALRMQALAVGMRASDWCASRSDGSRLRDMALKEAKWAYREATGREW